MEKRTDNRSLDLEQAYIRSQTSAWNQESEANIQIFSTAKGISFMPQAQGLACFQQVYDLLATQLRGDEFKYGLKAVAKIESELNWARQHKDPEAIDRSAVLRSLAVLQDLNPQIAAQTQDCIHKGADELSGDCRKLFTDLLKEAVAPVG